MKIVFPALSAYTDSFISVFQQEAERTEKPTVIAALFIGQMAR